MRMSRLPMLLVLLQHNGPVPGLCVQLQMMMRCSQAGRQVGRRHGCMRACRRQREGRPRRYRSRANTHTPYQHRTTLEGMIMASLLSSMMAMKTFIRLAMMKATAGIGGNGCRLRDPRAAPSTAKHPPRTLPAPACRCCQGINREAPRGKGQKPKKPARALRRALACTAASGQQACGSLQMLGEEGTCICPGYMMEIPKRRAAAKLRLQHAMSCPSPPRNAREGPTQRNAIRIFEKQRGQIASNCVAHRAAM